MSNIHLQGENKETLVITNGDLTLFMNAKRFPELAELVKDCDLLAADISVHCGSDGVSICATFRECDE